MKTKRKIDQKAIQQFFIDHTEKFVIGLVGLLFAYFAYDAFTLKHYPKSAAELQAAASRANDALQRGPATKKPVTEAPIPPYADMIEAFKRPIDRNAVAAAAPPLEFDWKQYAPPRVRDTPEVFAVEKLRAAPGRGAFVSGDGGQNGPSTVGQRWVVVTGLVPYRKQVAEYKAQFEGSALEVNMEPSYAGFLIQRAEAVPGSSGEPKWENKVIFCNTGSFAKQLAKWNGTSAEVVDPRNTWPTLTSPLPPLANGEWGDDVAHPSEIKILPPPPPQANPGPPGQPSQPLLPDAGIRGNAVIRDGRPRSRSIGPNLGGGHLMPNPGGGPGAAAIDDALGGLTEKPKPEADKQKAADETPEFLLLRYFDFDVEAGKQYNYRAFVILENPNAGLPANVLVEAELGNIRLLGIKLSTVKHDDKGELISVETDPHYAKWSQPCESSKMPSDRRLLAGATSPPVTPAPQEPTGEVRVLLWGEKSGLNLNYSKNELFRGAVLSFPDAMMKQVGMNQKTKINPLDMKSVLVDLAGGSPLAPKDRDRSLVNLAPGMMLVLDESGNLVIHDEMGESKEWRDNTKEPDRPRGEHGSRGRDLGPRGVPRPSSSDGPDRMDSGRRGGR